MIYRKLLFVTVWLVAIGPVGLSQDTVLSLSLDGAKAYAMQNNKSIQNARRDIAISDYTVKETIGGYLPKVNLTSSITDNLKITTTLLPAIMFGGQAGEYIPVKFGVTYNAGYGAEVSQVIFSGPLIVGIQTSKIYKQLSEQSLAQSERNVVESIINTYHLTLATEESLAMLRQNYENMNDIYTKSLVGLNAGISVQTELDKLRVQVSALQDAILSMERSLDNCYNLLKMQLGVDAQTTLKLTDSLGLFIDRVDPAGFADAAFNPEGNLDYQLVNTQVLLNEKSLLNQKAQVLPTLAGFYNYNKSGMGNELGELRWFPSSVVGLRLSMPLFSGFQKYHGIQKAKVTLDKSITSREIVRENLDIQQKQVLFQLRNAYEKYLNQRENIEVASKLLKNISLKYNQGLSSSLELIQVNSEYLTAQGNLLNAKIALLQAQTAFNKLYNNLK
jgi:outer membrane protein TolC